MTRFPKSGRGRKWTVAELKALPRDWKGDALADGDGLVGVVRVSTDEALRVHFRCKVVGTTMYLREHHFPNVYAGVMH